jgi:hypothetical protein
VDTSALFDKVISGGPEAIIALLLLALLGLLWERKRLLEQLSKKDEKIDKIIDDYHAGNITLADALNSLKNVLFEIKGKIG